MDILALPDVFLRQLMRTVEIKDRLKLRLVCRDFEKLVAESNAGSFDSAFISCWMPDKFTLTLGDALFFGIEWSAKGVNQRLALMNRLFSGITVEQFDVNIDDDVTALSFIRKVIGTFKIGVLGIRVQSDQQLENARLLMADFPTSKYTMDLCFLPESEKLLSLPPMKELSIYSRAEIPSAFFLKLLSIHENLDLGDMSMTTADLKKAVQVISTDSGNRTTRLKVNCAHIVTCMRSFGISESTKAGECFEEFEVVHVKKIHKQLHLRYRNVIIEMRRFSWTDSTWNVDLLMSRV